MNVPSRRPTIHDVAALSRVSKSTVSNVTRGVGTVAPETRDRVLEAIRTLGYRPNAVARNLVQQRTSVIGVVVGDLANAFYAELVKLMEKEASLRGHTTMICNTDGHPDLEAARIEALLEQGVGGLALLEFTGDRAVLAQLLAEGVPTVMVSCWADVVDSVAVDEEVGYGLAIAHLVELGHRRIIHVSDAMTEPATRRSRQAAHDRAVRRHRLATVGGPPPRLEEDEPLAGLVQAVGEATATAVVTVNDFTAIRVIEGLESAGRRVPGDVSVVGFDGTALGGLSRISLTSIAQPREELARRGVELLFDRIESGQPPPARHQRLTPTLIVRGSSGPVEG
jgi:LacI family transcriptional regulator, galactose operon repressor